MDKSFNELFDEFFKKNNIDPNDKIDDAIKDDAIKMIDMLSKFRTLDSVDNIDEAIEKEIDDSLGKPDKIEFYNEDDMFFEKRIWHTETGDVIKLIISDDPSLSKKPTKEKSLNQKLEDAVEKEDYEKAAAIRDEIAIRKKNN